MYAQNFVFRLIFGIFAFLVLRFVATASSPVVVTRHTLANIPLDNIWGLYLRGKYQPTYVQHLIDASGGFTDGILRRSKARC